MMSEADNPGSIMTGHNNIVRSRIDQLAKVRVFGKARRDSKICLR